MLNSPQHCTTMLGIVRHSGYKLDVGPVFQELKI